MAREEIARQVGLRSAIIVTFIGDSTSHAQVLYKSYSDLMWPTKPEDITPFFYERAHAALDEADHELKSVTNRS